MAATIQQLSSSPSTITDWTTTESGFPTEKEPMTPTQKVLMNTFIGIVFFFIIAVVLRSVIRSWAATRLKIENERFAGNSDSERFPDGHDESSDTPERIISNVELAAISRITARQNQSRPANNNVRPPVAPVTTNRVPIVPQLRRHGPVDDLPPSYDDVLQGQFQSEIEMPLPLSPPPYGFVQTHNDNMTQTRPAYWISPPLENTAFR